MRVVVLCCVLATLLQLACGADAPTQECDLASDCVQGGINGTCLHSPVSATKWCAFPDPLDCPSDWSWGSAVGDGLAGSCVALPTVDAGPAADAAGVDATADARRPDAAVPDAAVPDAAVPDAAVPDAAVPDAALSSTRLDFVAQVASTGRVMPVAVQPSDDGATVVVAGYYNGDLTVGTYVTSSKGGNDIYVAKFSTDSIEPLWVKTYGTTGSDQGLAVALGPTGDVYFTGKIGGELTIGATVLPFQGAQDVVLARLAAATGEPIWATSFGASGHEAADGIAVDSVGNAIITGYFNDTVDFGGTTHTAVATDLFVARYTAGSGALSWAKRFGSDGGESGMSVAIDSAGAVLVAGHYEQTVTFDAVTLSSAGDRDVFVTRMNGATGDVIWARSCGGGGADIAWSVATGGSDNRVALVGYFSGTATIGANTYTAVGPRDVFVLQLSSTGNPIWSLALNSDDGEWFGHSVAMDPAGRVTVGGRYQAGTSFGDGPITAEGGTDMFVARYDVSGQLDFVEHFGASANDSIISVAAAAEGPIAAFGYFNGTVDFAGHILTSRGTDRDGAVLLFRP